MLSSECIVQSEDEFGLFEDTEKGPLWRDFFGDLGEAKLKAKKLADEEGHEFFVYNFITYTEVARFSPTNPKSQP
jgi:hypothetical protein